MTFDDDVRLERPVGALTVACSIGKHRLCSGSGTELQPSGSGARHVPCVCPCHGSNSDKDPVAANERLREAQAVNAAAEGEDDDA